MSKLSKLFSRSSFLSSGASRGFDLSGSSLALQGAVRKNHQKGLS